MHSKLFTRLSICIAILLLASLACNAVPPNQAPTSLPTASPITPTETIAASNTPAVSTQPVKPTEAEPTATKKTASPTVAAVKASPTPPAGVYMQPFAPYPAITVKLPTAKFSGYTLPVDLTKVLGLDAVKLSTKQNALLTKYGFVAAEPVPGQYREFYQIYETGRYGTVPLFVTTDSIFHLYHLIFDKMLRDLESEAFIPRLNSMTSALLKASQQQLKDLAGTPLEEPALRNVAFFSVASQLLGLKDAVPAQVKDLVAAEIKLIEAHAGAAISPIWDRPDLPQDKKLIEDYGQYVPRGHYTRSEALKKYFKAMMWYGRLTFRLRDPFETRRALLLVSALRTTKTAEGTPTSQLWEEIYDPTVFIVGKADDLSYHEYGVLSDTVFGAGAKPSAFADDGKLNQFLEAAKQLPPPQINSMWVWIWEDPAEATQGFRVMGQRFTLDEYVFGQLIWRKVGTQQEPRMLPKGLDFFAALGSKEALTILNEMNENKYANYTTQMEKVQKEAATLELDSWTQNLYWSWLYAFQPVISVKDERYPEFMRTQAWVRKQLNTVLGSWTELKHDTILYAKQVMAEMGGGPGEEPPKGYVEPNPEVYARLLSLVEMTYSGLDKRAILSATTKGNLNNLKDMLEFLKTCSEKELAKQSLSAADYERIKFIGGEMEALTLAASDRDTKDGSFRDLSDQKAALVADVATGMSPDGQLVALEEAIGQPTLIYVILPDQPWRISVGAVFSYYEFTVDSANRMTDEEWQAQVEAGKNPPLPDWTKLFFAP